MSRGTITNFDFSLLGATIALLTIGIMNIYSSNVTATGEVFANEYIRQIIWTVLGLTLLVIFAIYDYSNTSRWVIYIYVGNCVLLLGTLLFGRVVNGARSWVGIGILGIQPSEFAKISVILLLARYLQQSDHSVKTLVGFLKAFLIIALPMILTLFQPDIGTATIFIPIFLVMTYIAGARLRYIFFVTAFCLLSVICAIIPAIYTEMGRGIEILATILVNPRLLLLCIGGCVLILALAISGWFVMRKAHFYWIGYATAVLLLVLPVSYVVRSVLHEYQIMRLIVFIDPYIEPRGAGWNVIQSVTAIGSGGLVGKGYLQGVHSHYRYLPEQSTDFIFSILAEEWGLIGGLVIFSLFLFILLRALHVVKRADTPYGAYLATGIAVMFLYHFFINVGMTIGIMPVIGIPLFFLSYGGSALITATIAIGILISVQLHVRKF